MREGESLIGTIPALIYKVLEQGVEKVSEYWFLFLLLRTQLVAKQAASLRPY